MNTLWHGDNLPVLRGLQAESVDLVYLDPPFKSDQNYNMLYKEQDGSRAAAQVQAFTDTWRWDRAAAATYHRLLERGDDVSKVVEGFRRILGTSDMLAYLVMMAPRLVELRRVLKRTGSIYLHCDPTASHYLKLLMDAIFSPVRFMNEVIWKRTLAHGSAHRFGPVHDVILLYSRSGDYFWADHRIDYDDNYVESKFTQLDEPTNTRYQAISLTGAGTRHGDSGKPWRGVDPTISGRHWALPGHINEKLGIRGGTVQERLDQLDAAGRIYWPRKKAGKPRLKWFVADAEGAPVPDVWSDIPPVNSQAHERLGYPTQKPEALLKRILAASSRLGDTVLDPFCGCGTTVAVAHRLGRRWIGIDLTHRAIDVIVDERLTPMGLVENRDYKIDRRYAPRTLPDIEKLAKRSKHEFQGWALEQAGIELFQLKPGADRGVDGRKVFFDPAGSENRREIIVSVKGGKLKANDVRDLIGAVQTQRGDIGVLLTLNEPSAALKRDAASVPPYVAADGKRYPRIQILTVKQLLADHTVEYPLQLAYTQAPAATAKAGPRKMSQPGLLREEQLELRAPRPRAAKAHLKSIHQRRSAIAKRK